MTMLTDVEKKVIAVIQTDLPITEQPYLVIAKDLGLTEDDVINALKSLDERNILRRFGATLRHQKSGFDANAMVAWIVPDNQVQQIGEKMAEFQAVSHCYCRKTAPDWPYNLYTMIHGKNKNACYQIADHISRTTGIKEYQLLFSRRELKKTSMQYYRDSA